MALDKQLAGDSWNDAMWKGRRYLSKLFNRHSDKLASGRALTICDDTCVRPNRNMLQGR